VDTREHTPDTGTAIQDVEMMKLIGSLLIKQSLVAEVKCKELGFRKYLLLINSLITCYDLIMNIWVS